MNTKVKAGEFKVGDRVVKTVATGSNSRGLEPRKGAKGTVVLLDGDAIGVSWDRFTRGHHFSGSIPYDQPASGLWIGAHRIAKIEPKVRLSKPAVKVSAKNGIESVNVEVAESTKSVWITFKGYRLNLFDMAGSGMDITVWTPGAPGQPVDWVDMLVNPRQFTARVYKGGAEDAEDHGVTVTGDAVIPAIPEPEESDRSDIALGVEIGNLVTQCIEYWNWATYYGNAKNHGLDDSFSRNLYTAVDAIEALDVFDYRSQIWDLFEDRVHGSYGAPADLIIGSRVKVATSSCERSLWGKEGYVLGRHSGDKDMVAVCFDEKPLGKVLHNGHGSVVDNSGKAVEVPIRCNGRVWYVDWIGLSPAAS